jgi:hypothetical protein
MRCVLDVGSNHALLADRVLDNVKNGYKNTIYVVYFYEYEKNMQNVNK